MQRLDNRIVAISESDIRDVKIFSKLKSKSVGESNTQINGSILSNSGCTTLIPRRLVLRA